MEPEIQFHAIHEKTKMTNLDLLFSFKGRIGRAPFWVYYLFWNLVFICLALLAFSMSGKFLLTFAAIYMLVTLYPTLAVNIKRCHDRGRSGWFMLVSLVPIVSFWYLAEVGFLPGESGENEYGAESSLDLSEVFVGPQGLRAGWSALILFLLTLLFMAVLGTLATAIAKPAHDANPNLLTPKTGLIVELIQFFALLGAGTVVAYIERRRILDYNLTGPRCFVHFLSGLAAGFVALSVLVGAMNWGGWLHFGPVTLTGAQIFGFAAIWGVIFLLTGLFEEGGFRCYLQCILTRGINFWWAAGAIGLVCLLLALLVKGNCVWGVYAIALLGLFPCLMLHIRNTPRSGFWQAAWVTSTFFGLIHITNNGENWIGIFAAALIGFVFCVSVRLTGTAWWAIGCHASWNWAESYFYGTPDSGMVVTGHYMSSTPSGNVLWSGGTDGPEGSLLVLGAILLLLTALLVIYGRKSAAALAAPVAD